MYEFAKVKAGHYKMKTGYEVWRGEDGKWYALGPDDWKRGPFRTMFDAKRVCRLERRRQV